MIRIEGFHKINVLLLTIKDLDTGNVEYKTISGNTPEEREAIAIRLYNKANKDRVSVKMSKWLKQREVALYSADPSRSEAAYKLRQLLNYFNDFSYYKLCSIIAEQRKIIEWIAPSPACERTYPFYRDNIIAILNECDAEKGRTR